MNDATTNMTFSADALRTGYEQLREQALGSSGCRGFGFALLVRAGLAAWLLACRESVSATQQPAPAQSSVLAQIPSHSGLRVELTMILTAMALGDGRATS